MDAPEQYLFKRRFGTVRPYTRHLTGSNCNPQDNSCQCPKWLYVNQKGQQPRRYSLETPSWATWLTFLVTGRVTGPHGVCVQFSHFTGRTAPPPRPRGHLTVRVNDIDDCAMVGVDVGWLDVPPPPQPISINPSNTPSSRIPPR